MAYAGVLVTRDGEWSFKNHGLSKFPVNFTGLALIFFLQFKKSQMSLARKEKR